MRKTILLARPHPFIVNEMKPLLLQAGFDVKGISSDSALTESRSSSYPAAVISLAVVSPVSQSPQQVLAWLKTQQFSGKFIFAGLIPFERVENNLKQFLTETGWNAEVQALSSPTAQHSPGIYIQQSDLAPGQAQASRDFLTAWI